MFTKAGLLIALALVFFGYRWGRRKTMERLAPPQPRAAAAVTNVPQPKAASWLSVKLLLGVVIVLLIIAIFTSLQR